MNWKQIYIATTQQERFELMLLMLRTIEARQRRWILVHGRLMRERRRRVRLHFINDRRNAAQRRSRAIYFTTFASILATVSVAIWLVAPNLPRADGALLVLLYNLALLSILVGRPYIYAVQRILARS